MNGKKLLVTLTLLFSALAMSGQVLRFGLTGGVDLHKVNLKDGFKGLLDGKTHAGWFIGPKAYVSLPFGLGADAALLYSHRKVGVGTKIGGEVSQTQSGLSLPLNARFSFGLGSMASLFIATGPQFNFRFQKADWSVDAILSGKTFGEVKPKKSDTAWNVGVGARFAKHFEVALGCQFPLSKYLEKKTLTEPFNFDVSTYSLGLTYIF